VALNEGRIDLTFDEAGVVEDLSVQRDRRVNALDNELGQRPTHARQRLGSRRLVDE
jgi:hypothetical protein